MSVSGSQQEHKHTTGLNSPFDSVSHMEDFMDKWEKLRETIQGMHENNADNPDVENVSRFLLNLMDVLDGKHNE